MLRAALWGLTLLYLAALLTVVFWPTHVDAGQSGQALAGFLARAHAGGYLPRWIGYGQVEWLANVLMFLPGGLLFTLLLGPSRSWLVPLAGLATTVSIEICQHFMPGRTSSLLDVLANSLGCAIGWVLGLAARNLLDKRNQNRKNRGKTGSGGVGILTYPQKPT